MNSENLPYRVEYFLKHGETRFKGEEEHYKQFFDDLIKHNIPFMMRKTYCFAARNDSRPYPSFGDKTPGVDFISVKEYLESPWGEIIYVNKPENY